jgi:hypothetical protein
LYHPFWSGARSAAAAAVGAVASYLSPNELPPELPATSTHVPFTAACALSGPEYEPFEHEATPDVASEPVNATPTARRYHPPASGPRSGRAFTDGPVAS